MTVLHHRYHNGSNQSEKEDQLPVYGVQWQEREDPEKRR